MSDVNTNKFGGALLFILGEFAAAEEGMIEDFGMEVFGEDDQGREGSCEVSINELAQAASDEIEHLTDQLAKANEREKDFIAYMHDAQKWFDRHEPNGYLQSSHPKAIKALKKFAIEKKLKALNDLLEEIQCSVVVPKRYEQFQEPYLEGIKHCIQFIECQQEQLRKEQE